MTPPAGSLVLRRGPVALVVEPGAGGAVTSLSVDVRGAPFHLLRPARPGAHDPLHMASFVLVPFANRIAAGTFPFGGRTVRLPRNRPAERHPLHGHGWLAPWTVDDAGRASATLSFRHPADEWPWSYHAVQHLELHEQGVEMRLALTNRDPEPMPASIGFHPYFPRPAGTRLRARLPEVWLVDRTGIPDRLVVTPPVWDFAPGRTVDGTDLDHCFAGWDGLAEVRWPGAPGRLALAADPASSHAQVFTPGGRDFFCFEPVTSPPDAVNLAARGDPGASLHVLAPGETLSVAVRLELVPPP